MTSSVRLKGESRKKTYAMVGDFVLASVATIIQRKAITIFYLSTLK